MNAPRRASNHLSGTLANRLSAAFGLIVLLPVFAVLALLIVCTDGWPIFFTQMRIGRKGEPFRIWKFRTMTFRTNGAAITVAGDRRITRVGAFLRRYKLDELPQLINVLRGEMNLIGPRPEVPEYVDCNAPLWKCILSVHPGITDPAALVYRDEECLLSGCGAPITFYRENVLPKKLYLSLRYLCARSFKTDFQLLMLTARCSFLGKSLDSDLLDNLFKREARRR